MAEFFRTVRETLDDDLEQLGAVEVHEYSDDSRASMLYVWDLETWKVTFPRLARRASHGSNITDADLWIMYERSGQLSFEFEGDDEGALIEKLNLADAERVNATAALQIKADAWKRLLLAAGGR